MTRAGETNLAMATGDIKTSESVAKFLDLMPNADKLYPAYIEQLRGTDRADLLA